MTDQPALFELEPETDAGRRPESQTPTAASPDPDSKHLERLVSLVGQATRANAPIERARLVNQVRTIADELAELNIREACHAGMTWREIGAALGIPFQTIHRRYGG